MGYTEGVHVMGEAKVQYLCYAVVVLKAIVRHPKKEILKYKTYIHNTVRQTYFYGSTRGELKSNLSAFVVCEDREP